MDARPKRRRRRLEFLISDDLGFVFDIQVGHSTTAYLRTILGREVPFTSFCDAYFRQHCVDARHGKDWLDWITQPNARTAWAIGEALYECGAMHASGTLMLLAAGRLTDFVGTLVGLDADAFAKHRRRLRRVVAAALDATRGTLYDHVGYGNIAGLPTDDGPATIERYVNPHSINRLFETLDLQREGEFLQRRHMARLAWQLPRDLRNGLADSFARWRRGHVFATERHAAIAMAIATHDMNAFDREESVIEALLKWLRDRETLPPDPRPREGVLSASAYRERWYTPVRRRSWRQFG